MTQTRNTSLDVLKGVAALFVIWIHEQFPGVTGQLIDRVGSFAVPVFFLVSGYFSRKSSRKKLEKSIRHTLYLIACNYALSFVRIFVFNAFSITAVVDAISKVLTFKWMTLWLVLNVTAHISGIAWFLFALLYCYILHWCFHRQCQDRRIFYLIPISLVCGFAILFLYPQIGVRNIWFMGIPYYLGGQWFAENQEHVKRIAARHFVLSGMIGCAILVLSMFVMEPIYYIGYGLLSASLFALCICFPDCHNRLLARMGSRYNFFIYVGHALMIHVFNAILPVGDSLLLAWIRPVLLAAATIGCAAVWYDLIWRK